MISAAFFSAAVTSLRMFSMCRRRSSTAGNLVANDRGGMNVGVNPYHISKGGFLVAWCGRALWANSMKGMSWDQLSCWKLQKIRRYCSSSWLTLSVSPSVCGWYAVLREDFTPRCFHSSWITLAANWGPRSEIICCGSPVLFQTCSRYRSAVCSAVMVL